MILFPVGFKFVMKSLGGNPFGKQLFNCTTIPLVAASK